jgi:NAD-dependent deacetylase
LNRVISLTIPRPANSDIFRQAAAILKDAQSAVALTGAGVSTPSGIPDFRSPSSGLWKQVDPMVVASIYGFRRNPEAFFNWIRPLAATICRASPNPAHTALARMEEIGVIKTVITQNIDMLHSRAGSEHVLEVHGALREATCGACFRIWPTEIFLDEFIGTGAIPRCPDCGGILKPNVILFGEQLPMKTLREAEAAVRGCDVMLIAGSSLEVAPASELPHMALARGARLILVNYGSTQIDRQAKVVIHDDVATVLPRLVEHLEGIA